MSGRVGRPPAPGAAPASAMSAAGHEPSSCRIAPPRRRIPSRHGRLGVRASVPYLEDVTPGPAQRH